MWPLGFQIKCVSGYWELTPRNGDGIRGANRIPRREGGRCSAWISLVPWEWEHRMRRGHRGRSTTDLGLGLRTGLGRTKRWEMEYELGEMERRKMGNGVGGSGRGRSPVGLTASLVRVSCEFLGNACWSLEARIKQ